MAYTDDGVLAKLSALNETQESIVTVAQWIMFHRYAPVPLVSFSFRFLPYMAYFLSMLLYCVFFCSFYK
jgi:hypothetical protein